MRFYLCRYRIAENKNKRITKIVRADSENEALEQVHEFAKQCNNTITKIETLKEDNVG